MTSIAEVLNRDCACISVDRDALRSLLDRASEPPGELYASILAKQPHLFASVAVFMARAHAEAMFSIVRAVERAVAVPAFQEAALALAPPIARAAFGPLGVFYGYDFHLGSDGPRLIEINTNAGGALFNAVLAQAQKACCPEVEAYVTGPVPLDALERTFVDMFRREWALQRGDAPLCTIAIVDEAPASQYLYPEFLLFQEVLGRAGIEGLVVAPEELRFEGGVLRASGRPIDLVYNRLTDFYLEKECSRALCEAYELGAVVVTPHPRGHALYADKRNMITLSDRDRLAALGLDDGTVLTLLAGVPRTLLVTPETRDALWAQRKKYFFKPVAGYGGKAAYRGDKLTTSTWTDIGTRPYVAQEIVRPSERSIDVDGRRVPLKLDVRVYTYAGEAQLLAARLYQGQTTNFRTPGGGFAPVFMDRAPS